MGFWHTSYIEFHEPTGLEELYQPTPTIYRCQSCEETFTTFEALRTHRFVKHPYKRPCLFISGIEIGTTPVYITKPICAEDVICILSQNAWINGRQLELDDLPKTLASYNNDNIIVKLSNGGVSVDFKLIYEIAKAEDLDGIDQCFLEIAKRGNLDKRSIEEFITVSNRFPSAIRYCDGICEYFYGVLAKERSSESSLEYHTYMEKFNRAEDFLKDYDRPLSREICTLISFHFNHFPESCKYATNSRARWASELFFGWISGTNEDVQVPKTLMDQDNLDRLLTDYETERLLNWVVMDWTALSNYVRDIESLLKQDISDLDKSKLRIFLTEYYRWSGEISKARYHARDFRNNRDFGKWAERILKQTNPQE